MSRIYWIVAIVMAGGLVLLLASGDSGRTLGIDSDAFARTLYLGIFGGVVAAGILGSGVRLGEIGRNLAIFLALILILVGGYQYRYELQDVASRLTAGLVPGSPISMTASDGRVSVLIEKRPNGHFETRATINGRPVDVLVDTGATTTVLSASDATAAGFDVSTLAFNVPISTANGTTRAARIVADEIGIGQIFRNRQTVLVASPGQLGQSLLGMSFLSTLSGYDVRGDRMVLID
ncbi:MAG: TIGR02281 family clan AA aspartic protease [Mesorhizobium sp.]|nr:TIGR02281 family clan AA aspartic protease [Mesorhizobium sp.]